jgi:hypothetical protein
MENMATGMLVNNGQIYLKPPWGLMCGGTINNHGSMNNTGTIQNEGRIVNAGGVVNSPSGIINNTGDLFNAGPPTAGSFVNSGTFSSSGTVQNNGSSNNHGVIIILGLGSWSNNSGSSMTNSSDGTFSNESTMHNEAGSFTQNGVYMGNGKVTGAPFTNGGTINAGDSPGILTFECDFLNAPDGLAYFEIDGVHRNDDVQYDQLIIEGTAYLDGTLEVVFLDDFVPVVGDYFQLITYEEFVDTFATLNLPDLPGDAIWKVEYTMDGLVLKVVSPSGTSEAVVAGAKIGDVYPNPAISGQIYVPVELEKAASVRIELQTVEGRVLYTRDQQLAPGSYDLSLPMDRVPAGMYLARVVLNGKQVMTQRIVR